MAVPSVPSVGSRALYYPFAVPAPVLLSTALPSNTGGVFPQAPGGGGYTQFVPSSVVPPDIGSPGVPLPATVLSVAGSAPDYSGLVLAVHLPNGTIVPRSAGFASGQPMLNSTTWASQGSNALQARWSLMDALA
jgi:hypothetical protein